MKHIFTLLLVIFAVTDTFAKDNIKLTETYAFTRGVEEYNNRNTQEALDWFNKELDEHPGNGYAFLYIASLRIDNEEYGKALTAINEAIKKIPRKDGDYLGIAYATRADLYLALEDSVQALNDYALAIKADPSNSKFYDSRAQIYYEQGKYALADDDYRKIIELDNGDVVGYMGLGRDATAEKRWNDALAQFNYVIKLASEYSSGYAFRAEVYMEKGKWNEAIDDIIKALSINGDRKAFYLASKIDESQFPLLKAKIHVQELKEPNQTNWPYIMGVLLEEKGKYRDAIKYYLAANKINAHPRFLERAADCYFELGEYVTALEYVNKALQLNSEDYDLVMMKGNIYNEMGDYTSAIAELDKYVAKYPDQFFGYYRRGWFKDEANDPDGAIEDYSMSIALEPEYAYAYCGRGRFYSEQGKKELADADFRKVIELDTVPGQNSCAQYAFYFLGQRGKAIDYMNRIIATDEDAKGNYYDAACLYSIMNEPQKAIEYLRKAFELGYRRIAHIYADHDLDNIRELPEFKALIEQYRPQDDGVTTKDEPAEPSVTEIPFTKQNGVTQVKCTINSLPLHFVFDTGASDVTMSLVEANFMLKNDYIKPTDVVGSARYMDANGDVIVGTVLNLREVDFGGLNLDNVRATVVRNQKAPLLLGQSVLGRLGKIEIDNEHQKLVITHNKTY